jgi:gamma-polyglutamate biosynthesis protein CapA
LNNINIENNIIKITFLGDIFPGELPFTVNYGIRSQFKKHKGLPWIDKIKTVIGENDLVIANLESPLLDDKVALKKTFYGEIDFTLFLKRCGINVANIANNHILEHGQKGFENTITALRSEGIAAIGYYEDSLPAIYFKEIHGKKIAVCGFSNVDLQVIKNDRCFPVLSKENVMRVLERMKEKEADLKILSFHWGNEYIHVPSIEQRKMAYCFIDAGADIIVGHHPHVIQPYEKYGEGHIFYSLGNFIFDYIHSEAVSNGLVVHALYNKQNGQLAFSLDVVKLSYKKLITLSKANSLLGRISERYLELCSKPESQYIKSYNSELRINHSKQRILMKTSFLKEYFRVSWKDKKELLRNVVTYYYTMIFGM